MREFNANISSKNLVNKKELLESEKIWSVSSEDEPLLNFNLTLLNGDFYRRANGNDSYPC
jgi:hypothetical protein